MDLVSHPLILSKIAFAPRAGLHWGATVRIDVGQLSLMASGGHKREAYSTRQTMIWALLSSRSPACPRCRRPPVLTPPPYEGEHPGEAMQAAACCCRWRCTAAATRSRHGPPLGRNRLQCRRRPLTRSQHRQHSSSRNARASSHLGSGKAKKNTVRTVGTQESDPE